MKKLFTNLKVALTLLLLCGVCNVWAETVTSTFTDKDWNVEESGAKWTADGAATNSFETANPSRGVQIMLNSIKSSGLTLTNTSIKELGAISKVEIVYSSNCGGNSDGTIAVVVGSTEFGSAFTIKKENNATISFENETAVVGNIAIAFTSTATSKSVYVKSITVTYNSTTPTKELVSIVVKTAPTKVTYTEGETFDPTGLEITSTYDDSSSEDVAYASNESKFSFDPALTTALQTTNTSVTITYGGKTVNQNITVNALPAYTVTLSDDSDKPLTEETGGEGVELPLRTSTNSEYTFAGWSITNISTETEEAPTIIPAGLYHPTSNVELYPVYKRVVGETPVETLAQTLKYDTWTYSGSTTDKDTYRLFHSGSYIESDAFDLSTLSKVVVYGGTFGGASYNSLTIGYSTNTWKSVTVSGSSQTGTNTYTDGTALNGTGKLRITSNSGSAAGTGVRISKVEIYTTPKQKAYYVSVLPAAKILTSIEVTGTPAEFWKGESFSHDGMTVTAYYDDDSSKDVTASADYAGYDMNTAGNQTVTVTYGGKSVTYDITVKTITNTLETAYTVAKARELIDAGKDLATPVYVKGIASSIVTEWNSQFGNISFDVSEDGTIVGQQFRFYRNFKGANKVEWTSAAECPAVGDEVIGYGTLTKYGSTYEFAEGNYFVSQSRDIEVSNVGWATVCLPFRATITSDNATAYYVTGTNGDALVKEAANVIPAGTGVLLKSNDGNAETVTFTASTETADDASDNLMIGSLDGETFADEGTTYYILANDTRGLGFYYQVDNGVSADCAAGKAVLAVPTAAGAKSFFSLFDEDVTGIEAIRSVNENEYENIYNLSGVRVNDNYKGIVIINGKKVVK